VEEGGRGGDVVVKKNLPFKTFESVNKLLYIKVYNKVKDLLGG
jgi:hypothetical protein